MKSKYDVKPHTPECSDDKAKSDLSGYPSYPEGEDIFNKYKEEQDLDPEDISKNKALNPGIKSATGNRQNGNTNVPGDDLDVPGSELDDALEEVGSEDEENNYYSLGGDDHSDLDENKS